jgi:ADP-ribosylglycohydrolase
MESIRDDVIGGFNAFLAEQQAQPGRATLTLVQFDSHDPYEVLQRFVPVQHVPMLTHETYVPRASTPLLDALGRGINDLEASLAGLPADRRPGQIVMVIVTDGQENASREFTKARVTEMIRAKRAQGWQFVFLSADLDAIDDAEHSGVLASHAMAFDKDAAGAQAMWSAVSRNTTAYRARQKADMRFEEVDRQAHRSEQARTQRGQAVAQMNLLDPDLSNQARLAALFDQDAIQLQRSRIFVSPPPALPASLTWDRVEGMLVGLAIGDSLGNTTESLLPAARAAAHGTVRDYLPSPHAGGHAVGVPSDDTQMAFWTLEQELEDGRLQPDRLAKKFCSRRIFGIGSNVRKFIGNYKDRGEPWYAAGPQSAGNGALMRIAPVLVPYLRRPDAELYADAALAAMLTHNDRGSTAACVAFVALLWDLLAMDRPPAPECWVRRYVEVARPLEGDHGRYTPRGGNAASYTGPLWRYVQVVTAQAEAAQLSTRAACDGWWSGAYLMETLPSVVYILARHAHDPEAAILAAVNDTKDNDTVAAIVGAAVGALHGARALPERWRAGLLGRTTADDDRRIFDLLAAAQARWF